MCTFLQCLQSAYKRAAIATIVNLRRPPVQVQVVEGSIKGIKMRFIDTPGLLLSPNKVGYNAGILAQVSQRGCPGRKHCCAHAGRMGETAAEVRCMLQRCGAISGRPICCCV